VDTAGFAFTREQSPVAPKGREHQRSTRVRICFMASGGGHFQELCGLAGLAEEYDHILISTKLNKALRETCPFRRIDLIGEVGQGQWKKHPGEMLRALWRILRILLRERPDLVISTGAGIAVPGFLAAKLLRIRTIYVESYARVESLSLAGRVCYRLSNLFIVQHAGLAGQLPHAVYVGSLNGYMDADSHGVCNDR
jgi:UDP-N-acetylglucosamine:LPS N-acetylglucosamine transferase